MGPRDDPAAAAWPPDPLLAVLREPAQLAALDLPAWDRCLRLARAANLLGRLAVEVDRSQMLERVPVPVKPHLVAALRLVRHQQVAIADECRHVEAALASLPEPVVLLKGAAYACAGITAARGRLFGDVDILVPHHALQATEAALMLAGWSGGGTDPYDERYYRQWMHELPPLTHVQRGTVIDVHHNILPTTARVVPDAALLIEASLPLPGRRLRVLSALDRIIHSAVHLFHEGELRNGLRDLLDLDALMREQQDADPGFWAALLERARQLRLQRPLHLALRYAALLAGTPVPPAARQALAEAAQIGRLGQAALDAAYRRTLRPEHPLARVRGDAMARWALYLRSHALRMPPRLLALHLGRKAMMRLVKHSSRQQA